jgi:hypothetical protein
VCPISICVTLERFSQTWYNIYAIGDHADILKSVCHGDLPERWHANNNAVTEFRIVEWCIVIDTGNVGKLHSGLLLGLFFYPENIDDMFLRYFGCLSANYTALCPRR